MPRVICDLPNASAEISGVKFHKLDDGRLISDEISDEAVERFCSIKGYILDEEERDEEPEADKAPAAPKLTKAQQKALTKKQAAEAAAQQPAEAASSQPEEDETKDADQPAVDTDEVF